MFRTFLSEFGHFLSDNPRIDPIGLLGDAFAAHAFQQGQSPVLPRRFFLWAFVHMMPDHFQTPYKGQIRGGDLTQVRRLKHDTAGRIMINRQGIDLLHYSQWRPAP